VRNRLFKTRRGAIVVSALTALVAAVLLIIYLRSYRSSVSAGSLPERVLVATRLIASGTSGTVIAHKGLYQVTTVQKGQLVPLAISDPAAISGEVASTDIYPGQQLTLSDFTAEGTTSINYQLTGNQRAIAVPVDTLHGLLGQVAAGDLVDVYISVSGAINAATKTVATPATVPLTDTQVRLLASDIMVLAVPTAASSLTILRITAAQLGSLARGR
jgi:Flp pilus assembly protein CpaB